MKKAIMLMLASFLCAQYAFPSSVGAAEVDAYEKYLLATYKPTKENCGAAINITNTQDILGFAGNKIDKILVCMISGNRQVMEWDAVEISPTQQKIMNKYKIQYLVDEGMHNSDGKSEDNFIFFTPEGEENARFLLIKAQEQNSFLAKKKELEDIKNQLKDIGLTSKREELEAKKNELEKLLKKGFDGSDCLTGILLGYDSRDILKFYEQRGIKGRYETDQKKAQQWIEQNKTRVLEMHQHKKDEALDEPK